MWDKEIEMEMEMEMKMKMKMKVEMQRLSVEGGCDFVPHASCPG